MGFQVLDSNKYPERILNGLKKNDTVRIIALSDTHVGGVTSYLPSGCVDERGNQVPQSLDQEVMEANLLNELQKVGQVDIIMTLGDMVEGRNSKASGFEVGNTNVTMQINWGVKLMNSVIDILKPKVVMGLEGSEYHVEQSSDYRVIYQTSLHHPNIDFYFGLPNLKFFLGQKLWFLTHRLAGNSNNTIGVLERYWKDINNSHYGRDRTPDVIGYGHVHKAVNPVQLKNGEQPVYGFVVPCQKMPDSFTGKGPKGAYWEIGFSYIEQTNVELYGRYHNTYRYWEKNANKIMKESGQP